MSIDVKLVAYEANGAFIGELPQPLSIESADPLSDTPSLQFKYSQYAAGADILGRPIEVAREIYNPVTKQWIEPINSRFMLIRTEGDRMDTTGVMTYIAPGIVWQLSKIQVYPLTKGYIDGQVQNATATEKTAREKLNKLEDYLCDSMKRSHQTPIEYSDTQPSNQDAIWVNTKPWDTLKIAVPWVYDKKNNKWIEVWDGFVDHIATGQVRATNAYKAYIAHQQTQGQLRDTEARAKATKRVFTGKHAGQVLHELIAEARARGNRLPGLTTSFTATKDSAGNAWPSTNATIEVNTGTSLLKLLQTFIDSGQVDFRTLGRTLQLFAQDSPAVARDLTGTVALRYGHTIDEAPDKATWENLASEVLFLGESGMNFTKKNVESPVPWGIWETSISQSNVDSEATGQLLAGNALKDTANQRIERTRALLLRDDIMDPLPYVHFQPGDYVMAPNSSGVMEKQRLTQITLTKSGETGHVAGNIVLNDRFLEREIKNQRTTEALVGGGSIGGTGGTRDPETYIDLRTPEAPRYLNLDAEVQAIEGGRHQAIVGADWWWSRRATDGTSMEGGLAHYDVQYRLHDEGTSSFDGNTLRWISGPQGSADANAVVLGPLEAFNARTRGPAIYEVRVRANAVNGKVSAWSSVARIQVPLDDTPPEPPSRPSATADGPLVSVTWDGQNNVGGSPPPDFSHMIVEEAVVPEDNAKWILYGLTDAIGDEPDQAAIDIVLEALEWTVADAAGDMVSKGTIMVPSRKYETYYSYRLVAQDYTGNKSTPSKPSNLVQPKSLVDVSKIQAELDAGNLIMDGVKEQIYETMKVTRDKLSAEGVMEESVAKAFYGDIASFIKISTTQLMVSDPVVYTPNFNEDPGAWFLFGEGAKFLTGTVAGIAKGGTYLSLPGNVLSEAVAPRKQVYAGDKFGFIYDFSRTGGANGTLKLIVRFYDAQGTLLPTATYTSTATMATSGSVVSEDKTLVPEVPIVPAGAHEIETVVQYAPGTVTTGSIAVANVRVHKQVGATLIQDGAITTDKIVANAITAGKIAAEAIEADHIKANAITADKIVTAELWAKMVNADMFVGKEFNGGTFTGSTIQTSALANRGVKIDAANGIRGWSSTGTQTLDFDTNTGHFAMTGRIRTGLPGEPGIIISNSSSGWNGVDQGIWFTRDGTAYGWGSANGSVGGLFSVTDPDDTTKIPLHIRGHNGAGVYAWDQLRIAQSVDGFLGPTIRFIGLGHIAATGELHIRPSADLELGVLGTRVIKFTRGIGTGYNLETGASANMRLDDNGFLFKSTSARKYKANITEYTPDPEILNTPLLRWQDKRSVETYERLKDAPRPFIEEDQQAWNMMDLTWHIGSTSEDALAHKADAIVTYANGEVDGLSYDRFAFMMLPFLRELWEDYKSRTAN